MWKLVEVRNNGNLPLSQIHMEDVVNQVHGCEVCHHPKKLRLICTLDLQHKEDADRNELLIWACARGLLLDVRPSALCTCMASNLPLQHGGVVIM